MMKILNVARSSPTQDGDGVKISRVSDFSGKTFDPFLMIDELKSDDKSDYMGGFPAHPHRGIETFTYIIKGGFEHQDQMGNKEVIAAGDVQWMSTGFGVVHSEMPVADEEGMHGFQIWVNMPAKEKLRPSRYQDSTATGLPEINGDGVKLRALAGHWEMNDEQVTSPLSDLAASACIADVTLAKGKSAFLDQTQFEQVFLYVHTGEVNGVSAGHVIIVDASEPLNIKADSDSGVLVFSAQKINEKIAHMGPFVMNTDEELRQAIRDYQSGKFGEING